MDDERVMHGLGLDEAYHVERVLASRRDGAVTERVTLDGAGPFIRKKIPLEQANRSVWAELSSCTCLRLPQISATYELPDTFVVVYAYVSGETLETRIEQQGALDASEAVRIALDVCEAAGELHAHGIVHCDIKPKNIVLAADGAHLIDMDIACMLSDARKKKDRPKGTVGFAAPEQFFGRADARSDVHAIGCVLGYMLTGIDPEDEAYEEWLADGARITPTLRDVIEQACNWCCALLQGFQVTLRCSVRCLGGPEARSAGIRCYTWARDGDGSAWCSSSSNAWRVSKTSWGE